MSFATLETDKVLITIVNDTIFRVHVKDNVELSLHDLDVNYHFFIENRKNKKVPFLIVMGKGATSEKGALEKFREKNRLELKEKEAFVLSTLPHRIMASLYIKFSKQNHPTKIFSNEKDALKWLKK